MTIQIIAPLHCISFFCPTPLHAFLKKNDPSHQGLPWNNVNGKFSTLLLTRCAYRNLFQSLITHTIQDTTKQELLKTFRSWKNVTNTLKNPVLSSETLTLTICQIKVLLRTFAEFHSFAHHLQNAEGAARNNHLQQALHHILKIPNTLFLAEAFSSITHFIFNSRGYIALAQFFETLPAEIRTPLFTSLIEQAPKEKLNEYANFILTATLRFLRHDAANSDLLSDCSQLIFEHFPIKATVIAFCIPDQTKRLTNLREYLDELLFTEGEENDDEFAKRLSDILKLIIDAIDATNIASDIVKATLSTALTCLVDKINDPLTKLLLISSIPENSIQEKALVKFRTSQDVQTQLQDNLLMSELTQRVEKLDKEKAQFCSQALYDTAKHA